MSAEKENDKSKKEINIEGDVETSGDIVGGDKEVQGDEVANQFNIYLKGSYDLKNLFDELLKVRGKNDPTTLKILRSLREIKGLHNELQEWKELHNYLNIILMQLGQLTKQLQRLDAENNEGNRRDLKTLWNPIKMHVNNLLNWAKSIKYIHDNSFEIDENNNITGPWWAIDVHSSGKAVDTYLMESEYQFGLFYEAAMEFNSSIESHMYQVDQNLRESAGSLNNKSEIVLGSLNDVEI